MTTADPISLAQAQRLSANADTILLRATRPADLETPIGAFLRLDDGGPAYLLESVEGGERLGRYSFLGVGPRRLLEVRDGIARIQTRPVTENRRIRSDLPIETVAARDPLEAIRAFVPRRRVQPTEGMPRFTGGAVGALAYDAIAAFEPTVPLPERDPGRRPDRRLHRDRPRPRLRPPDPHAVGDRVAPHRGAGPRGPLSDRRGRDLRGARADVRPSVARDGGFGGPAPPRERPSAPTPVPVRRTSRDARTSDRDEPGRDEYIHAVEVAKDAIAAGEAIQVVLARRQSFELPADPATGAPLDGIGLYRALRRVNPSPYLFFVRTPGYEVVGASPELLLQVEGDRLTTHPIAGTRPRGADAREDALLAEELQRDPKERAEHVMLVDLGRNDLGRVARPGTVTVSKYMEVERYSHVLHLVSHVEARLRPELDALDALRSVFPAGHPLGGAQGPGDAAHRRRRGRAARAVRRRRRLPRLRREPRHRDHDPERRPQGWPGHVHTGAGIVAGSVPEREFEETEHKAAALRRAIEMAAGVPEAPRGGAEAALSAEADAGEAEADDPRHRQLRQLHVQPRPGAPGGRRRRPRRPQRRDRDRRRSRSMADDPDRGPARDRHLARPRRSGRCRDLGRGRRVAAARGLPLLGVCLGMQSMAAAFGASIVRAPTLVHGEASEVTHDGAGLLAGMPPSFMAARYHSLAVDPATLPPELRVTAMSEVDRVIMGIRHVALPLEGVQFHPESVLTPQGPAPARQLPAPGRRGRGVAARRRDRLVRDGRAGRDASDKPVGEGTR